MYGSVYLLRLLVLWSCNYLKIGKIIFRKYHFFFFLQGDALPFPDSLLSHETLYQSIISPFFYSLLLTCKERYRDLIQSSSHSFFPKEKIFQKQNKPTDQISNLKSEYFQMFTLNTFVFFEGVFSLNFGITLNVHLCQQHIIMPILQMRKMRFRELCHLFTIA